jgi:hypothetical protein
VTREGLRAAATHLGPNGLPAEDCEQVDVDCDDQVNVQTRVENVLEALAVRVNQLRGAQGAGVRLVMADAKTH